MRPTVRDVSAAAPPQSGFLCREFESPELPEEEGILNWNNYRCDGNRGLAELDGLLSARPSSPGY